MLNIDSLLNITLTRGDTAYIDVTGLKNKDGTAYTFVEGDAVYFRLKGGSTLITKELDIDIEHNKATLTLYPDDTEALSFTGYKYEMELVTSTDEHFTFIADKNFYIGIELEAHNG